MDIVLSGLPSDRCLAYMDDISVFSPTFEEYIKTLQMEFSKLREAGITLKLSKCKFASDSIYFFGYNLSQEGVHPQAAVTEAIKSFARPTSKKELKRFLGMIGFYRNFISRFSDTSHVLNKLTSDKVEFQLNDDCEAAFLSLKNSLCMLPVLAGQGQWSMSSVLRFFLQH